MGYAWIGEGSKLVSTFLAVTIFVTAAVFRQMGGWTVQQWLIVRIVAGVIAFVCYGLLVYWGTHGPTRTSEDESHA